MKKSLVAMATLAVAGMASAQSSVTLFGVVDAGVSYYDVKSNSGAKQSSWQQSSSGYNTSRLGFRGTEDLGAGLAASFWLEGALNNDTGTGAATGGGLNFQRRSTVSLSGPFGEVRLGRDYTATFWNDTTFDPFGTNGVGANILYAAHSSVLSKVALTNATSDLQYVRASNAVSYFLPTNLGGFYGQVQYSFHEQIKDSSSSFDSKTNQYAGGRFGYANGPLDVAVAYGESTVLSTASSDVKVKTGNIGASYDFGMVKVFGELSRVQNDFSFVTSLGSDSTDLDGALIGVTVPVGAGLIRATYSTAKIKSDVGSDPKADKYAIGYVHNLSKRTALYATYAHISNKDGANLTTGGSFTTAATKGSNGYDFGIRHSF